MSKKYKVDVNFCGVIPVIIEADSEEDAEYIAMHSGTDVITDNFKDAKYLEVTSLWDTVELKGED